MSIPRQTPDRFLRSMFPNPAVSTISFLGRVAANIHEKEELLKWGENLELAGRSTRVTAWSWDFETGKLEYAPHFREVFGFAATEPVNYDTWMTHLHPNFRESARSKFAEFLKGGSLLYQEEHPYVTASGNTQWVQTRSRVERSQDGAPLKVTSICIDITREKSLEVALRESEERYRALFEQTAIGIARLDLDGSYLEVNEKFCQIAGHSREELLKMTISDIRHADDAKKDPDLLKRLASGDIPQYSSEERYLRKDGSSGWLRRTLSIARNVAGAPQCFISVIDEITQRKQIEQNAKESRQRLEAAIAAARTGTFRFDFENNEWSWDENVARLFGLPQGHTLRTFEQFLNLVVPQDRLNIIECCNACKTDGKPCEIEFRVIWPDGTIHTLYNRGTTFRDLNGNPTHLTGAFIDLTEEKAVEAELQASREFLLLAQSAAGIGIWEWDPATDRQKWSPETFRLFGMPEDQEAPTMQGSLILIHPDDRPMIREILRHIKEEQQEHFDVEFRTVPVSGEVRWVSCKARVHRAKTGSPIRVVGACYDITSHRQAEETIRQGEKLAVAGRMAASIAHEINNPLAAVLNLLYIISNSSSLKEAQKYAFMAQEEILRVTLFTTHSLRFHRQSTRAAPIRVSDIVDGVTAIHQERLQRKNIRVTRDFRDTRPLLSWGDELRQLFGNLFINALEAVSRGGRVELRVFERTNYETGEKGVCVLIADTGRGMNAKVKRHLFEPFFTTKEGTGIGLGLWVSSEIVKKHSGFIRIRSNQDEHHHGTVVSVFLPFRNSENLQLTGV